MGILKLTKSEIWSAVRKQLAIDLNCSADDLVGDGFVFCESKENSGRRPFPRGERHFEMLTMGSAVIISATPDLLPYIRKQLDGKTREDAFNMPFVHGVGICYLPDKPQVLSKPDGFDFELLERGDVLKLYDACKHDDFPYALSFNIDHPRPDVLASTAIVDGKVVGIAGSSMDCEMLWQIGINVLYDYRKHGIATVLTNMLALAILERSKIPYYATAPGNIASHRVAISAGFKPAWTCVYKGIFDGELTLPATG
jgi:hypothetical protein